MTHPTMPAQTLSKLSDWLATRMGLNFPAERKSDLERGMAAAASAFGMPSAESCAHWLLSTPPTRAQIEILASCLTVGETYFFRDECCFMALETNVLPELIHARMKNERRLRIWSAGCCTGEEPYSIAMLIDRLIPDARDWNIAILATDINPSFLRRASEGVYAPWSFRNTSVRAASMAGYFQHMPGSRREIKPSIRKYVSFSYLNLADDIYPSMANNTNAMDVIFCRNVMQYFTADQAERVCRKLQDALVDGGWLIVAPAETWVQPRHGLKMVEFPGAIFYQKHRGDEASLQSSRKIYRAFESPSVTYPVGKKVPASQPIKVPETQKKAASVSSEQARQASYHQARSYANEGKLTEAAACCEAVIAANKTDPIPQYLLAIIQQEQGRYEQAVQSLKRALYLDHSFVLAHFALGNLYSLMGRPRDARRHFRNALELLLPLAKGEVIPESDGLSAGRLAEIVTALLESLDGVATANA
ncbi:protein-glutamate O-methyltransferase [Dyella nitratireducens]|uniref:Protein-glutamate O-methyltransferase n=2 Tax=Dyella nitratireducens TaxID=1849580 RepID=A0ABQ1GDS6_9GAMM|nr:protein-glutamate O-methyltransferase [Dyella nitratireducens]GLQ42108.1 protein-glutamate O-methyltransferase [Dyella nitratireducens]